MAVVRYSRAAVTGTAPTLTKVRLARVAITGTAPAETKVRYGRLALVGTPALVIQPLADVTTEPERIVTIVAQTLDGVPADSFVWRRISGPAVELEAAGAQVGFTAPSLMPQAGRVLVLGVRATAGAQTSPERTVTVTVLAQTSWIRYGDGPWKGRRIRVIPR